MAAWLISFDEAGVCGLTRYDDEPGLSGTERAENAQASQVRLWGATCKVVQADDAFDALQLSEA
jgi:hypothetical protein